MHLIIEFGFIWFCDLCIWDVWYPHNESPLTRCPEGQHLAVLANPHRKAEPSTFEGSFIFADTFPCSCNREWFKMSVNAESPSSAIQLGKNTFILWSPSETRVAKQTSWQSLCNLVALKNLDDAPRWKFLLSFDTKSSIGSCKLICHQS